MNIHLSKQTNKQMRKHDVYYAMTHDKVKENLKRIN